MENLTWYRLWFNDSSPELFSENEIDKYAKRFNFDPVELRENGEIEFYDPTDPQKQIDGGVIKIED